MHNYTVCIQCANKNNICQYKGIARKGEIHYVQNRFHKEYNPGKSFKSIGAYAASAGRI